MRHGRLLRSLFGVELVGPIAFEVDSIGQHEHSVPTHHARLDQVGDLAIGLLFHPGVDGFARGVRGPRIIERSD